MRSSSLCSLSALTVLCAMSAAGAQGLDPGGTSFTGSAPDRPGCPAVRIHLTRSYQSLSGFAFYANGSGVSRIDGSTDGRKFSWDESNWTGKGPVGHVDGTISPEGAMHIHLVGTNCSFDATLPLYHENAGGNQ